MATADHRRKLPDGLQEPLEQPAEQVLRRVWNRLHQRNEHFMGVVVGREGSGKSLTAIKLANLLDSNFSADNVLFRPEELLVMLRDEKYEPGDFYVLDEAGVGFGNRTWQDRAQRLANQALQLIRDHNIGVIFTLPRLGELDSQTQGRLQAFYEIDEKVVDEYVEGRWKWIDPDRSATTGKIYKKYPRTDDGARITKIRFEPPPASIIGTYQERKRAFQQEIYNQAIEELTDDTGDEDSRSPNDIADEILSDEGAEEYIREFNGGTQRVLDKDRIGATYELSKSERKEVKSLLMSEVDDDVM